MAIYKCFASLRHTLKEVLDENCDVKNHGSRAPFPFE